MDTKTQTTEVARACQLAGGQASLARLLGVTPPTINQLVSGTRPVPPRLAVSMEMAFPGEISRRRLCPTDWQRIWPELADREAA